MCRSKGEAGTSTTGPGGGNKFRHPDSAISLYGNPDGNQACTCEVVNTSLSVLRLLSNTVLRPERQRDSWGGGHVTKGLAPYQLRMVQEYPKGLYVTKGVSRLAQSENAGEGAALSCKRQASRALGSETETLLQMSGTVCACSPVAADVRMDRTRIGPRPRWRRGVKVRM